jgi:hypothetical protein
MASADYRPEGRAHTQDGSVLAEKSFSKVRRLTSNDTAPYRIGRVAAGDFERITPELRSEGSRAMLRTAAAGGGDKEARAADLLETRKQRRLSTRSAAISR